MALTGEEKQQLSLKISKGTAVISSSIAQLYLSSPDPTVDSDESEIVALLRKNGANKWLFMNIEGALLLIKDPQGKIEFRIYELNEFNLKYQCELYIGLEYHKLSDQFHAFEIDSWVAGFNFSNAQVAEKFYVRVQKHIPNAQLPQIENLNIQPSNTKLKIGILDPNNVPKEWKKLFRQAGIKKKDLKNPAMYEIIEKVLNSHNIALEPPEELNMSDPKVSKYYTPQQLAEYKEYQQKMKDYKADKSRFDQENAEYTHKLEQQKKIKQILPSHKPNTSNRNRPLPAVPRKELKAPRASIARPTVPALPVIPKEERIAKLVNSRASRVVMKNNMLKGLKSDINLKRVSVLPTIKNRPVGEQNSILETLRQRLAEQRGALTGNNDDEGDSGSEWEED